MHLSKPIECTKTRMNSNVNCGLWMIMKCQSRIISCDNCPALVGDVDDGGGCACGRAESTWEISTFPSILL